MNREFMEGHPIDLDGNSRNDDSAVMVFMICLMAAVILIIMNIPGVASRTYAERYVSICNGAEAVLAQHVVKEHQSSLFISVKKLVDIDVFADNPWEASERTHRLIDIVEVALKEQGKLSDKEISDKLSYLRKQLEQTDNLSRTLRDQHKPK